MSQRIKLATAMSQAFRKTGEALSDFGAQLKALTPEDKEYFHKELVKSGVDCEPPVVSP
jgi:hypothetical protein